MGLQDVDVPRHGPGMWRIEQDAGESDVFELIDPQGRWAGCWWPGEVRPPGLYLLLVNMAAQLNADAGLPLCTMCGGERAGEVSRLCMSCVREHRGQRV